VVHPDVHRLGAIAEVHLVGAIVDGHRVGAIDDDCSWTALQLALWAPWYLPLCLLALWLLSRRA
jgi:hypothetical protein